MKVIKNRNSSLLNKFNKSSAYFTIMLKPTIGIDVEQIFKKFKHTLYGDDGGMLSHLDVMGVCVRGEGLSFSEELPNNDVV